MQVAEAVHTLWARLGRASSRSTGAPIGQQLRGLSGAPTSSWHAGTGVIDHLDAGRLRLDDVR